MCGIAGIVALTALLGFITIFVYAAIRPRRIGHPELRIG